MATGTLAPSPYLTVENGSGIPYVGAKITTYLAGTTTPTATYTDVGLTIANANPIITDAAGRYVAYLAPGVSYKFVITDANGVAIRTQDNISAVPSSSGNLDILGVAGEGLSAVQVVYLSDGSGGKTAGQWFKADSANAYSSVTPEVGIVIAAILNGASGAIRQGGQVTGLSSLTIGTTYYVGTAGALTATPPTNSRIVGVADTVSSLVLGAPPAVITIDNAIVEGRLTLTTAVPVTTADVTAATTVFFTPYRGNRIALYSGTLWTVVSFAELSIAVPATTSQMYDVFIFSNAGVATLELLAWTNDTTRATALVAQDGVLSKTGALTRRYLGSFRTTTVSGQTEDSATKRYVWNYYNRMQRWLQRLEATTNWTYTTATVRQANGAAANQVDVIIGIAESLLDVSLNLIVGNSGGITVSAGIGEDSTTTYAAGQALFAFNPSSGPAGLPITARLTKYPAIGRHFYSWNEWSTATGTTTWISTLATVGGTTASGLNGYLDG